MSKTPRRARLIRTLVMLQNVISELRSERNPLCDLAADDIRLVTRHLEDVLHNPADYLKVALPYIEQRAASTVTIGDLGPANRCVSCNRKMGQWHGKNCKVTT